MKRIILLIKLTFLISSLSVADVPFKRGFNFAGWLQTSSVRQIQFTRFTKQDFMNVKNMGCDHIRLPMHLFNMPEYTDENLIYTFHFYDPFLFTHQGASWVEPVMDIEGVPFPYDPIRMPDLPFKLKGTWIEDIYNRYKSEGNYGWVKNQIDIAVDFTQSRNVPLWCGEFGAFIPNNTTQDRARWLELVRSYFEENSIAWSVWEFADGFGIYDPGSNGLFDFDVNIPIIEALGLNPPEQKDYSLIPDTTGFIIYDDYIAPKIFENSWVPNGILSYYSDEQPVRGNYCIYWTGVDQYGSIGLRFSPIKDLSQLVDDGYAIDFWVRCTNPAAKIDIRFLDTKTENPNDHPWRMRCTIDAGVTDWDGEWQHLQLPLDEFFEHGSWDNNQWYNPIGDFDWTKIQYFEIVAEHHNLLGINFYFDNIRVINPSATHIESEVAFPTRFRLLQNYPNPFNSSTSIQFYLKKPGKVSLTIFNIAGQKVYEFERDGLAVGSHSIVWFAEDIKKNQLSSGVYICKLESENESQSKRILLLK